MIYISSQPLRFRSAEKGRERKEHPFSSILGFCPILWPGICIYDVLTVFCLMGPIYFYSCYNITKEMIFS